jgi:O-antigen ligase
MISTIFAYRHNLAFLGDVEREEGFLGLTFFYSIFLYTIILFKKKDWYTFWGLLLSTQVLVFGYSLAQLSQGLNRTNSILGNPIYFSVYALCLLCISLVTYIYTKKQRLPVANFFGVISIIIAIIEIFLGNTRAVLLGIVVAIPVIFVYALANSSTIFPKIKKNTIRLVAISLFSFFLIFSTIFLYTKDAKIWTHIPGLDRVAASNINDSTTRSRLVSWSIAVSSVNPQTAGIGRFLVGYGWDNYFFAWQKFYNPDLYQYDKATFDHPHNKVLDMLVMNGFIGFVLYMIFWVFFVKTLVVYRKKEPLISLIFIFWAVAYFVQNLFAFDSIISWIISFAIFAFIVNETLYQYEEQK